MRCSSGDISEESVTVTMHVRGYNCVRRDVDGERLQPEV
ncbi:hypothetical protein TNCV_1696401, partial [Trichonephila clavipes]